MNAREIPVHQHGSVNIDRSFLTAGKAIFTVSIPSWFTGHKDIRQHYTYCIRQKVSGTGSPESNSENSPLFASLLAGPDNISDYVYIGVVNRQSGRLHTTTKSKLTLDQWPVKILDRVLRRVFSGQQQVIENSGFSVMHCGLCCRCGRVLTTPESLAAGVGPECARFLNRG